MTDLLHFDQTSALHALRVNQGRMQEHLALHRGNIDIFAEQLAEGSFPGFSIVRQHDDLVLIDDWARDVRKRFKHLVIVGMGGASLGAHVLAGFSTPARGEKPTLHFLSNPDPVVIETLCRDLPLKDTALLAVSKSGETLETLLSTGLILDAMTEANVSASNRAWALTKNGATPLAHMVQGQGGGLIRHEPDMVGRYSVFSNVGLLPGVLAGIEGRELRKGAQDALNSFTEAPVAHPATQQAAGSVLALGEGFRAEVMMPYGQQLALVGDWWAQLWAESLGKEGRGTTPVRAVGPADQHSQLQLYADGPNDKLHTFITVKPKTAGATPLSGTMASLAGKRELNGLTADGLLHTQATATAASLTQLKRPVRMITLPNRSHQSLGALLMHLMLTTVTAGIMWRVNPFDQPAVEDSKTRTRSLLLGGGQHG